METLRNKNVLKLFATYNISVRGNFSNLCHVVSEEHKNIIKRIINIYHPQFWAEMG